MIVRPIARLASALAGLFIVFAPLSGLACSSGVHIEIKESGVYALDHAAITRAQPALRGCRADDLYLLNHGKEVPIRVVSHRNGEFGDGDRIEWLGSALHGPQSWFDQYSSVNVYQLGAKPGAHARVKDMAAVAAPAKSVALQRTLHAEQENLMLRVGDNEMKPGEEPDVWQWAKLTPIDPKPFSYTFDLPDFDAGATKRATSSFTFDFRGMSNVREKPGEKVVKAVDHVVDISVNDKPLQRFTWDGRSDWRKTIDVANSVLKEKGDNLTIRVLKRDLPGGDFIVDVVMFNWFEANYPIRATPRDYAHAFNAVDDGAAPIAGHDDSVEVFGSDGSYQSLPPRSAATLTRGVDFFASSAQHAQSPSLVRAIADDDARAGTAGYDYIIVAHPRLLDAIRPLADYHRDHGLKVAVYNVDDVYDQFNGGIVHPSAIRDLVAWGLQHWDTKPRYLLLVGDASFDIHHDLRAGPPDKHLYSPSVDPTNGMMLGDGFFALPSTSYAGNDELPNRNLIPTWQFPTFEGQSASDNGFVSTKPGDFHPQLAVGRLPVVSPSEVKAIVDKTIAYASNPTAGDWRRDVTFVSTSEVASFKQTSDAIAADLQKRGFAVNNVYSDFNEKDAKRYQGIRDVLRRDLDAGNLLVHFIGHGGQYIWRVGPIGDLFTLDDVSALTNVGRYPMVLAMTCFSAPFDHPTEDSIGERFLREPGRGAVAVFAASWKNWPDAENSRALIHELLKPGMPIGDAIVHVKSKTADRVLVEMYNLLGDPALVLAQPRGTLAFQLADDRWNRSVAVRIPAASFGGNVDVDWLDAKGDVMESKRYQARDTQFSLPVPKEAAQVQVFVSDTRNGFSAMGAADVVPPKPAAKPGVAKPMPVVVKPRRARNPKDDISERDFDAPADAAPTSAPPASDHVRQ